MRTGLLLAMIALAASAAAASGPHTAAELLTNGEVRDADLSPDGQRIAIATATSTTTSDEVAIISLTGAGEIEGKRRIALPGAERTIVEWVAWATDRRLLMSVLINPTGFPTRRIYAINADGTGFTALFAGSDSILRRTYDLGQILDFSEAEEGRVAIPAWVGGVNQLYSVNIFTGAATPIAKGRSGTIAWGVQKGQAVLRFDTNYRGSVITVYGRATPDDSWEQLTRYARRDGAPEWEYVADGSLPGEIYVLSHHSGEDKASVYQFDLARKTYGERIASHADFDLQGVLKVRGRYYGAWYYDDRLHYLLDDKTLQRHIDGVNRYFGDVANVRIAGLDRNASRVLLRVDGSTMPVDYYLYDTVRKNLQFLRASWPGIEPERLATTEVIRTTTRDGLVLGSYLTRLRGAKPPLPLVVMPHGGPEARDHLGYDRIVQAFAAQGWAVLQTNFRGSGGYGKAFAEAGYRQWSLRMQDDLTDAVDDVVRRGLIDPRRIAISGASYGGYAALAGVVSTPDLFRAAISLAGVSDLGEFLDWKREDGADSESYRYWVKLIGDRKKDSASVKAASPRLRAAEIKVPVLLVHGVDDATVPIEQSRLMKAALEKLGKPVQLIEVAGEGHSGWSVENDVRYVEAAIKFLESVLK
ncbi:MAG: alpha/beta fold hydrolase [Steroidobacteraceae bacterium]